MKQKHRHKWLWILPGAVIFILLYVIIGVLAGYGKQPELSAVMQEKIDLLDCRSDSVSSERVAIIEDNKDALVLRLRLIQEARERIILSTFDFRSDESGLDILAALLSAAERGVKIQILVDGVAVWNRMSGNPYFIAVSSHPNAELRAYNRLNLLAPWKSMGRMHDKYLMVDDRMYLLGGRNFMSYFLGEKVGSQNYDRDFLVYEEDPAAVKTSFTQLEEYFQTIWDSEENTPFHDDNKDGEKKKVRLAVEELLERAKGFPGRFPELKLPYDYVENTMEANKITLLSNPIHVKSKEPVLFAQLIHLMSGAKEVRIHTPYIICNEMMYEALAKVREQTKVILMTNSVANNGNPFGASDYQIHRERLMETGISILEYEGERSYHAKSLTIDDDIAIIGSFNMDMRSVYLDTELMLVVHGKEVNAELRDIMQEYEEDAARVISTDKWDVPEGMIRKELSAGAKCKLFVFRLINWLRFLM